MTSRQMEYPPLLNGLDYMESVVEHLQGEPTGRDLKYAIMHLVAGTEVLLKMCLSMEHYEDHVGDALMATAIGISSIEDAAARRRPRAWLLPPILV